MSLERKEFDVFCRRYPNKNARIAADLVLDSLPDDVTLSDACGAWNDAYLKSAGSIVLEIKKK